MIVEKLWKTIVFLSSYKCNLILKLVSDSYKLVSDSYKLVSDSYAS
jgi:hypothetical protein